MPLSQSELAELSAYVNSPAGASDNEAREALAEEMRPARAGNAGLRQVQNAASDPTGFHSQASAPGPSTNAAANTGPSRKNLASPPQPNEQRATQPSFTDGKTFPLPNESAAAWNSNGAVIGGMFGGTVGSRFGPAGRVIGSTVGGTAGSAVQQMAANDTRAPRPPGLRSAMQLEGEGLPQGSFDPGSAAVAGGVQGAMSLGLMGLGQGITKLGFPRIGAFIGGVTPQRSVASAAPSAANGVSTDALQAVDNAASPAGAVQQAASGAQQALQDAPIANAADRARPLVGPLRDRLSGAVSQQVPLDASVAKLGADLPAAQAAQSATSAFPGLQRVLAASGADVARTGARIDQLASDLPIAQNAAKGTAAAKTIRPQLAQGATDIAPLNAELAKQVRSAFGTMSPDEIADALRSGKITYQEAQVLMQQSGAADLTQAFRHPQRFPQTAGSPGVAAARVPVADMASEQKMLSGALGQANDARAAALSRGVGAPDQIASDLAGASGQQAVNKAQAAGSSAAIRAAIKARANADLRGIADVAPDDILARLGQRSGQAAAGQSDVAAITDSLGQANRAVSAASARGLAPGAGPQLAADAQGLKSIANLGVKPASLATAGGAILGGVGGLAAGGPTGGGAGMVGGAGLAKILTKLLASGSDEAAAGIAPVAIRGGQRAQQTVSAMLANRGLQSANPLSDSAGYQLVNAPNALDAILAALSQNRSKK